MIELHTGVPGSGKTLSMVQELARLQGRWEKHPDEARPVFVHNIKDLALPHSQVPLVSVQLYKAGEPSLVPDWSLMPDGSLVIVDEAQHLFPPRSTQAAVPEHVAWLNTHRHKGFDIWLTTQHPKLIDGSVRALVGRHKHFRRLFGTKRAVVYEWDACADSLSGLKQAVKSYWSYPKKVFQWYKSAEVHTKQRFKLPLWLGLPFIALAVAIFSVPTAYSTLTNAIQGKGLKDSAKETKPQAQKPQEAKAASGAAGAMAPGQAAPAAQPQQANAQVVQFVGCISNKDKCQCMSTDGRIIENLPLCKESSERVGLLVQVSTQANKPQAAPVPLAPVGVQKS